MSEQAPQFTLDEIVAKYIGLRDQVAAIAKKAAEDTAPIQQAMTSIETYLMNLMNQQGQTKIGTSAGTAFVTMKTGVNIADKDGFWNFVQENPAERRGLLTLTANKTSVEKYMEGSQGIAPPGINYTAIKTVQIRRA